MGLLSKLFTFINGQYADANQVNADFDQLYAWANGNVDSANAPLLGYAISGINANTVLAANQVGLIECTAGAAGITVTLPAAAQVGLRYILKKVDSGAGPVTINTTSSQTIDGQLSRSLVNQNAVIEVISNGAGWDVIRQNVLDLPYNVFRQALINGNFVVAQTGTSFLYTTPGNRYTLDQWYHTLNAITSGNVVIAQNSVQAPTDQQYCLELNYSSAVNADDAITQIIETLNAVNFRGKKVTLSVEAKVLSGTLNTNIKVIDGTNTDAFPSTSPTSDIKAITLTSSFQTFTLSHIVQAGANSIAVRLMESVKTGFTGVIYISKVQLCVGDVAPPSQPRSYAEELALCQRYCQVIYDETNTEVNVGMGFAATSTIALILFNLITEMRVQPSLVVTAGDWKITDGSALTICTGITVQTAQNSRKTPMLRVAVASGLTANRPYALSANSATNKRLIFDARL